MKRKIKWIAGLFAAALLLQGASSMGQSLSPQVSSSSGGSGSAGAVTLGWTLGQTVFTTLTGSAGGMLTQGFHQTYLSNDLLPILLLSFDAEHLGEEVALRWATQREWNNDYFTVERSANGLDFEGLMEIKGAGNSTKILRYTASDHRPLPGVSYYRLRQTDFDGTTTLSDVVHVTAPTTGPGPGLMCYPNPARDEAHIAIDGGPGGAYRAVLCDLQGRLLREVGLEERRATLSLRGLPAGMYMLLVSGETGDRHQMKIVKQD